MEKQEGKKQGNEGDKKKILIIAFIIVLVVIGLSLYLRGSDHSEKTKADLSTPRNLGSVIVTGGGLPGYDIDEDGTADYLSKGFGYYKKLNETDGFDYTAGRIEFIDYGENISLPGMRFIPDEIVESGVGSVAIFSSEGSAGGYSATVIFKTLGAALSTYTVSITDPEGTSYTIIDVISEDGSGMIGEREVEISDRVLFRE